MARLQLAWQQRLPRPILIFLAATENGFACSGRSGNEICVRFYSSLPQRRTVSPAVDIAATRSESESNLRCREGEWFRLQQSLRQRSSASDSNFRCHEGEWFRLQQSLLQRSSASDSNLRCHEGEWFRLQRPWRLRGPLPIPFSAAAKENGSPCNGRGGYEVRVRF